LWRIASFHFDWLRVQKFHFVFEVKRKCEQQKTKKYNKKKKKKKTYIAMCETALGKISMRRMK